MTLHRLRSVGLPVMAALLLGACAAPAPVTPYDRGGAAPATVAVVRIAEPARLNVVNVGGVGMMFGAIGGAIEANTAETRGKAYTEALRAPGVALSLSRTAADALAANLERGGHKVVRADDVGVPPNPDGKDFDYGKLQSTAGAVLHVFFTGVGYVSPQGKSEFEPQLVMRARLVDTASRRMLYEKVIRAGSSGAGQNADDVACGAANRYASFDALMASAKASADGLRACVEAVALAVANDLRRTPAALAPQPRGTGVAAGAVAAVATAAPAAPAPAKPAAAAAGGRALALGDRLRFEEFDIYSGARTGERMAVVTKLGEDGLELDYGKVRLGRGGRSAVDTTPIEPTFSVPLPPSNEPGVSWESLLVVPVFPALPPSKADMRLVALEERQIGNLRLPVARVSVAGYSARPSAPTLGVFGNERFTGELLVDTQTGLLIEGTLKSTSRVLAFQRKLVDVIR